MGVVINHILLSGKVVASFMSCGSEFHKLILYHAKVSLFNFFSNLPIVSAPLICQGRQKCFFYILQY